MLVSELPKINGSANFTFAVGRKVNSVFLRKPKMYNLIFDLIDVPISRTLWRAIPNAII
jgi:hypothetical protein